MTLKEEVDQLRAENSDLRDEVKHQTERAQLSTVALIEMSDRVTEAEELLERRAVSNPQGWPSPWVQVHELIQSAARYALPPHRASPEVAELLEQRKAVRAAPLRFRAYFREESTEKANDLITQIKLRLENP